MFMRGKLSSTVNILYEQGPELRRVTVEAVDSRSALENDGVRSDCPYVSCIAGVSIDLVGERSSEKINTISKLSLVSSMKRYRRHVGPVCYR